MGMVPSPDGKEKNLPSVASRSYHRINSNNSSNRNKNVCGLAVAAALGVDKSSRYLHTISDLVYTVRKRWNCRSRGAGIKGKTVGAVRGKLAKLATKVDGCVGFIVRVDGHVLLLNREGKPAVDTDPRKRDMRKITHCYIVYRK
jgi:hypothetical protein